ncbi:cryptococcal mannosyltransferase 1-domain-containing protein [Thelonectria olida]|uniref:Cryptococcal mannosyltransferase 1-domain-containing protein n=1 Tax=Thelonectria olida TaxID=1576542 RepID=A0A9P9AP46_9HYPO|nr:cryptococcal mannosyltransferase 1-domain-containing protein [Thelonectria olida]
MSILRGRCINVRFCYFHLRNILYWRFLCPFVIILSILNACHVHHRLSTANRTSQTTETFQKGTRVYVASLHWNNERVLRDSWNRGILDLVQTLGPDNVFVSVLESGSWDGSKAALRELDQSLNALGASRSVKLDNTTHADEIAFPPLEPGNGWIKTARGRIELRRIPFLARLRNASLQPLKDMAKQGITYDYVLFLNDVVFNAADVLTLLETNSGDYAAACSLDFGNPPAFYDTFALRDINGNEHATQVWPYFRSFKSRQAMKRSEPVPVTACWNGMVTMPADTFTGDDAVGFRGIDDSLADMHLEASECCLIHADNPASKTLGVYLNPNVRVGYDSRAYEVVHPSRHGSWVSWWGVFTGLWKNRFSRWLTTPWFKEWAVRRRIGIWRQRGSGRQENGTICLVNEMQVLAANGWNHV